MNKRIAIQVGSLGTLDANEEMKITKWRFTIYANADQMKNSRVFHNRSKGRSNESKV